MAAICCTFASNTHPFIVPRFIAEAAMGKIPVKFREVVYTLSPYEQNVMGGLWRDIPHKVSHYSTKVWDVRGPIITSASEASGWVVPIFRALSHLQPKAPPPS